MLKKAMITAAFGAAVVGGGTAALAASGHNAAAPTSSSATPTSSTAAAKTNKHAGKHHDKLRLRRVLHATWVTKDAKTNAFVTHDAIHGTVSAVSSTSITVKATDGVSETYQVSTATKVRKRAATTTHTKGTHTKGAKAASSSISQVKVGDKAVVVGTGTTSLTATHIVDGLKK